MGVSKLAPPPNDAYKWIVFPTTLIAESEGCESDTDPGIANYIDSIWASCSLLVLTFSPRGNHFGSEENIVR